MCRFPRCDRIGMQDTLTDARDSQKRLAHACYACSRATDMSSSLHLGHLDTRSPHLLVPSAADTGRHVAIRTKSRRAS